MTNPNDIKPKYVGIDPSLNSTAVCVELTDGTEFFMNYTTAPKATQWMKRTSDVCFYSHEAYTKLKQYSPSEVVKVLEYGQVAAKIGTKLAERQIGSTTLMDGLQGAEVAMEGYSYGSSAGPLIDLVTFGSALRRQIIYAGGKLSILSPMALKVAACKMSYGVDKKGIARNDIGLAGGKFTKSEMMRAMFEMSYSNPLREKIKEWKTELYAAKNVPKPFDDLIDAYFLKEAIKRQSMGTAELEQEDAE